jgi:hypothetical protein
MISNNKCWQIEEKLKFCALLVEYELVQLHGKTLWVFLKNKHNINVSAINSISRYIPKKEFK